MNQNLSQENRFKIFSLRIILSFGLVIFSGQCLWAQVSITSSDGGTSTSGNLYETITSVNSSSGENAILAIASPGPYTVTLNQALLSVSQSVTFLETAGVDQAISIIGENEAEGAVTFQQNLTLGDDVTFNLFNDGTGGAGQLDASVTALNFSMGVSTVFSGTGGELDNSAGTAGSASVSVGTLTLSGTGDNLSLTGGELSNNTYVGGAVTGGSASVNAGTLTFSGTGDNLSVTGGELNNHSSNSVIQNDGTAGSASVSVGTLNLLSLGSTLSVTGGLLNNVNGAYLAANGFGGGAAVTVGTLSISGAGDVFNVTGGEMNNSNNVGYIYGAGFGGNASLTAANLSLGANTSLAVTGGKLENSNTNAYLNGIAGGAVGGNASITIGTSLTLTGSGETLSVTGGEADNTNGYVGSGVVGGNASLIVSSLSMTAGTSISVVGGLGIGNSASNGSASVSFGSWTGSGTVTIWGNSALLQVDSGNFTGELEGNTSLQQLGSGALTLTGANSYSGGTSVSGGILNIQNDGNLGTAGTTLTLDGGILQTSASLISGRPIALTSNNGTVDMNGFNPELSGIISGSGNLAVTSSTGTGALILAGVNTYSGGTSINNGTLMVANSSALGTGSVVNGGTLSNDGSPITINIGGNYTQTSSGIWALGLRGMASDQLNITGTALLNGTLQVSDQPHGDATFLILNSTGLSGNFSSVLDSMAGDSVSVIYGANTVTLNTFSPTFAQLGLTLNQKAVGAALDNLTSSGGDPALIDYLNTQSNSSLPGIYDQLSPSNLTPMFKINFSREQVEAGMVDQRLSQMLGDAQFNSNDVSWNGASPLFAGNLPMGQEVQIAKGVQPDRWSAFASGAGDFGTVSSDGNGAGYQFSTGGTVAGLDYRFSKNFIMGLMLGYDQSGTSQSTGTVSASGGQLGLYAGWKGGPLHITALVDGGLDSYTTEREGLGGTANGTTSGAEYTGALNAGYDMKAGDLQISPFITGQYSQVSVTGFSETGSLAPLTYGNQDESYLSSDLGAKAGFTFDHGGVDFSPTVSAAWEHVYQGNVDSLTANFGTGSDFTVNGPAVGADGAVLGVGLSAKFSPYLSLYAGYEGKFAVTDYTEQNLSGGLNIGF